MNKEQFTQHIADNHQLFGIWSAAAHRALDTDQIDLYVDHWIEQYKDESSRLSVIRTLGEELTETLKTFFG